MRSCRPVPWLAVAAAAALTAMTLLAGPQAAAAGPQGAGGAGPATVTSPYSPAYHHPYRHGVIPTIATWRRMQQWHRLHPANVHNLSYGGGLDGIGVTTGQERVYLVFYGSQWGAQSTNANGDFTYAGDPSGVAPYLQEFFKGLGTDGELWSGVMTQYCEGVAAGSQSCPVNGVSHVAYPYGGTLAGVWADESVPSPQTATPDQLAQEAINAAGHFGNTAAAFNRDAQYVIISPTGTDPDNYQTSGFCAWHDWNGDPQLPAVTSPYGDVAFTNLPYLPDAGASCGQDFVNPNGTLDGLSIVGGHEYAETITDQNPPGGWIDVRAEDGDKCAWIPPGTNGGAADLTLATGSFAVQSTWANDANGGMGGCELSHPIVPPLAPRIDIALVGDGNDQYWFHRWGCLECLGSLNMQLLVWDDINPVTGQFGDSIVTKPGCQAITRPDGASAGIAALEQNVTDPSQPGTYCIDYARSSRPRLSTDPPFAPGGIAFVALAGDAVTYATRSVASGGSNAPPNLTTTQLAQIYQCQITNWAQAGGRSAPIHPFLPRASSATRAFFLTALGGGTPVTPGPCVNTAGNTLQENEGINPILNDPDAIVPYSVADYIAQAYHSAACIDQSCTGNPPCYPTPQQNPAGCDEHGVLTLNEINGTAPVTPWPLPPSGQPAINTGFSSLFQRAVYDVVRYAPSTADHIPAYLEPLLGYGGWFCSDSAAVSSLKDYGFLPEPYCGSTS